MDPLPLVTGDFSNADVTCSLRRAFQETLDGHTYDVDLARTVIENDVDRDLNIAETAGKVLEISDNFDSTMKKIDYAGKHILEQQILYITGKEKYDKCLELKEHLKLKHRNLIKQLEREFVQEFSLIEDDDLLPDLINQYLGIEKCLLFDLQKYSQYYRIYNVCKICSKEKKEATKKHEKQRSTCVPNKPLETGMVKRVETFKVTPEVITFHNYIHGQSYKRTMKIVNTGCSTQSISIKQFPKNSIFFVHIQTNSKLAPGMSLTAIVIFQPKVYRTLVDDVIFKNNNGHTVAIPLRATRDLPELITYIFKSTCNLLNASIPGTLEFSDSRREALNSCIDCGSCLVGQYVLMSVLLQNKRIPSKFFIITEDDWFSQDVESVSTCMEINKNGFWIYPTFFEIGVDEIVELNIIFEPIRPGLHLENLLMICDNNSFEQLEVVGDALEFSKSFIEIRMDHTDEDMSKKQDYCINLGCVENKSTQELIFYVDNKSSLCLKCIWKFQYVPRPGIRELKEEWIKVEPTGQRYLVPYSESSFKFDVFIDSQEDGYHGTHFRFFILNVPMTCLEENQEYLIIEGGNVAGKTLTEAADIEISDFEVVCMLDILPKNTHQVEKCDCETCEVPRPRVMFTEPFLNIGILPIGVNIRKKFHVQSLVNQETDWKIAEIRYNIDFMPHMEVLREDNLSCNSGTFHYRGQMQEISYDIINRKPMSSVTILVLLTANNRNEPEIESICIVCYEIFDYDIVVNTGHSAGPILCPLELLYVGVPTQLKFDMENHSPIAGGFYFLKLCGKDSDKISIEFDPQSSILKPFETRTVVARIVCSEVGLYENLTVPCFVGINREPIAIRVLCGVDCLHVCFYLQGDPEKHKQVVWPPRIVYEFENDWSLCECSEEQCLMFEDSSYQHTARNSKIATDSLTHNSESQTSQHDTHDSSIDYEKTVPLENNEPKFERKSLEEILRENFDDEPFMLEEIMEIRDIPLHTPTKTTIYIKNITPLNTTFAIDVQNFYGNKNFDKVLGECITKNRVSIWNNSIGTEYGILVQPETATGSLIPYGSAEVNVWIFANTYGIYSEEITIDFPDIPPFSFTLLIEIIGSPVVFPITLNSLIGHPMIRIGDVAYTSLPVNRQIKIRNISCVPLHIVWHTFVKMSKSKRKEKDESSLSVAFDVVDEEYHPGGGRIVLLDKYLGKNTNEFCGIKPLHLDIDENIDGIVNIFLDPKSFPGKFHKTYVECHIIGHIYLRKIHRSKLNYFYRPTDPHVNRVEIEVSALMDSPILTLDSMCGETKLIIYANDIILKKIFHNYARLVFRNDSLSTCEATIKIDSPFSVKTFKGEEASQEKQIVVKGHTCQEVIIACFLDSQQILELSSLVYEKYRKDIDKEFIQISKRMVKISDESPVYHGRVIYCTDMENKMLHIRKPLRIVHVGKLEKIIPIEMFIYFPNIKVKPANVKFGSVLLNSTMKTMISVYNLTGCAITFEIYKSANATAFFVTPHFGEIPKSTGVNKEFVDIFIYFTPNECKAYQESIRIVTNIPNYFIEIPIIASGTVNEKFYVDYKI